MANNVGVTSEKLPRTIGSTMDFDTTSELASITMITGELDYGCFIFDDDGTLGICTGFKRDDNNNPIYTIRTSSLNTEIDIQNLLSKSY